MPPTEERDIVAQQMDMVGRPNPFAQFLAGRTIAVGEKLELPKDLAAQIFNLGDKFGEVTRFTLTLQKIQPEGGANCAVFLASVEAVSSDASQMRLQVEGPLVVQVDSCRAVRIGLVGPIGMSETRGSYSTAYQVIGTGRLQMNIASTYREAKWSRSRCCHRYRSRGLLLACGLTLPSPANSPRTPCVETGATPSTPRVSKTAT